MGIVRFHVFSGTGNGRRLALDLASRLEPLQFVTEIKEVSAAESLRLRRGGEGLVSRDSDDLDLFIFPVYAMAVPRIMVRYMRSLGRARGFTPRAALLSTNGRISDRWRDGHEGQSLAQAERILRRRGWDVTYQETLDYPQSITSFIPAQDEGRRARIMGFLVPKIEEIAADLASGRRHRRPCPLWAHVVGWPFGWLYRVFGRRAWAMLFAADERCDGCGICAARCPAGAITMRGRGPDGTRPDWSYACEGCHRCINLCPKKAIQTSILRIALLIGICATIDLCPLRPLLASALSSFPAWVFESLWSLASVVLGFAVFRCVDLGLVALSRLRFLRPVLAFGWTRWTRRYPDPSKRVKD